MPSHPLWGLFTLVELNLRLAKADLVFQVRRAMIIVKAPPRVVTGVERKMLDQELYRQAYALLQDWGEAAETERLLTTASLSFAERWRQFQALVMFSRSIQPQLSPYEQAEKQAAVDRYYEAVQRLEEWRQQHGRSTRSAPAHGSGLP